MTPSPPPEVKATFSPATLDESQGDLDVFTLKAWDPGPHSRQGTSSSGGCSVDPDPVTTTASLWTQTLTDPYCRLGSGDTGD